MAGNQTRLQAYLEEEIKKYKGVYVPIKSGVLRGRWSDGLPANGFIPTRTTYSAIRRWGPLRISFQNTRRILG